MSDIYIGNGNTLWLSYEANKKFRHGIPKYDKAQTRISVTFRIMYEPAELYQNPSIKFPKVEVISIGND